MEEVSNRTERQLEIVQKFADNKGRGTLLAATGFGKTFTAIMVILRMLKSRPKCKIIVVVPTIIVFNGEEVERFQANIMMEMEATKKDVQEVIDEIIYSDF